MKILAIETSCDETAVAILETKEGPENTLILRGNALLSQADLHAEYGGVYPNLAKREHQGNLVPLTVSALEEAGLLIKDGGLAALPPEVNEIREATFKQAVIDFIERYDRPAIDLIAVTEGPGLEPALWTGITFARAIGAAWDTPVMGIDHMEGHIVSALLKSSGEKEYTVIEPETPLLSLLISGGHTEFVLMKKWFEYDHVGETKDDAVGEAFDKVARLLGLQYPGGPKIAEFAARSRERGTGNIVFPRPMANDATCDFSFSGLKTAVLYKLRGMGEISEEDKEHIAEAFENAARDIITLKTKRALQENGPATFVVGGGVSANAEIKRALSELIEKDFPHVAIYIPQPELTGDNAVMIGTAAYLRHKAGKKPHPSISASGNKRLFARP